MKKSLLIFTISFLVLTSISLHFYSVLNEYKTIDLLQFCSILIIIGFAIYIGIKRLRSEKIGEPVEDELSKKILQKTAAISYYISLYIWVFLIFLKDRVKLETEELLGTGILAMAMTFGITWFIINFKGINHE